MRRIITITGVALAVLLVAGVAWAGFGADDSTTTTSGQPSGPATTSTTTGGASQADDDLEGNDDSDELRFACDPTDGFDQELATIQLPAGQEFEIEVETEDGQTICKVDFKDTADEAGDDNSQTDDDLGGNGNDDELRFACDPSDGFDQELATIQLPAGQEFDIEVENEHGQTVCKVEIGDDDSGRHGGDNQSDDDRGGEDNSGPGSGDDDSGHHGGGNSGESADD
jgi:hypothetical protein